MRESQIVYFFRDVCGHPKLTKELLRQRSQDYQTWVEHFALNHKLPCIWAEKHDTGGKQMPVFVLGTLLILVLAFRPQGLFSAK